MRMYGHKKAMNYPSVILVHCICLSYSALFSQKAARKHPVIACLDGLITGRNEHHFSYVGKFMTEDVLLR